MALHTPLALDAFAFRQFDDPQYTGSKIPADKQAFIDAVNLWVQQQEEPPVLVDGYAPFCKHIFVPNFTEALLGDLEITAENRHLLKSGYQARNERELPVLGRWFDRAEVNIPKATFLDLILYSREQIREENKAQGVEGDRLAPDDSWEWGIISIKCQSVDFETPMQPITMLRNALGKEEGGSGVPLDRSKYLESVAYWEHHATIL